MGTYGSKTGIVLWFDSTNLVGQLLGLNDGEIEALFDSDGKIKAGGGQVILQQSGMEIRHDTDLAEVGYGIGGYGVGGYGGVTAPVVVFTRTGSDARHALFKTTSDNFIVGYSADAGSDGYALRWKFNIDGTFQLPVITSAPASPETASVGWADGSGWNPGAGAGMYVYDGAAWRKLHGYGN